MQLGFKRKRTQSIPKRQPNQLEIREFCVGRKGDESQVDLCLRFCVCVQTHAIESTHTMERAHTSKQYILRGKKTALKGGGA